MQKKYSMIDLSAVKLQFFILAVKLHFFILETREHSGRVLDSRPRGGGFEPH